MRSSFSRVFTAVVLILLLTLSLVGISFQILIKDFMQETVIEELTAEADVIVQLVQASGSTAAHNLAVGVSVTAAVSGNDSVIFDAAGKLVMCSDAPLGCEHRGLKLGDGYFDRITAGSGTVDICKLEALYTGERYVVAKPIRESGRLLGVVLVSCSTEETAAALQKSTRTFLMVSVLGMLLTVLMTMVIARQQSDPLKQMARAARDFGHGEFESRVTLSGGYSEEMEELALAFNNMASSLQKSEYQRQEFIANVSHELKTPMTTISGYVDGILDGTIPPEKQAQYLSVVSEETKRLNRLVRSMLDISRLQDQGGIPEESKMQFDLCESVGQVLITFEQKINEKKLDVQVQMPEHPIYTLAQRDQITQVIYNLVDNGVKFSPEGGALSLSVREGGAKAYIAVTNDGPTIPPQELPLVFDRFHKTDKSRSENRDSWGLGLYIVKTIIGAHGEDISVASRDGKTTFTFTMPLVN